MADGGPQICSMISILPCSGSTLGKHNGLYACTRARLYTKSLCGYKKWVYKNGTKYLLRSVASGATGATGAAEATAQTEKEATEGRLLVNGEYIPVGGRKLTKNQNSVRRHCGHVIQYLHRRALRRRLWPRACGWPVEVGGTPRARVDTTI